MISNKRKNGAQNEHADSVWLNAFLRACVMNADRPSVCYSNSIFLVAQNSREAIFFLLASRCMKSCMNVNCWLLFIGPKRRKKTPEEKKNTSSSNKNRTRSSSGWKAAYVEWTKLVYVKYTLKGKSLFQLSSAPQFTHARTHTNWVFLFGFPPFGFPAGPPN